MHPPAWDYTSLLNNSWPTCWSWEVHQQHFFWVKTVRFFPRLQCPLLHSISDHQECHRSHLKINTPTVTFSLGALSSIEPTDGTLSFLPLEALFSVWEDLPEYVKDVLQGSAQQRTDDRNQGLGWWHDGPNNDSQHRTYLDSEETTGHN